MNDRELLELAAKAAGYEINFDTAAGVLDYYAHGYDEEGDVEEWWNPLLNDGDALRLAAKLKIDIEWQATSMHPMLEVECYRRDDEAGQFYCAGEHENDYRRAIVRAAAEIGRAAPAHPGEGESRG